MCLHHEDMKFTKHGGSRKAEFIKRVSDFFGIKKRLDDGD